MRGLTGMLLCAAALAAVAPRAGAQGVYKCVDARGRITYTSQPCENLGQKSGGEVRDTMNVAPAPPAPPPPAPRQDAPRAPAPTGDAAASAKGEASVGKPPATAPGDAGAGQDAPDPNKRCFTVKTAKGVVTRCNDRPADDDAATPATPQ